MMTPKGTTMHRHFTIDRRAFLAAGTAGLLLPARPALAGLWPASGFTHGVASGDPGPDSVKLWTRYAAKDGRDTVLKVEVAEDMGFQRILARAEAAAGPASWGTAQARVSGLPVGQWAYYRFTAPDGSQSPVGRTRTLPQGPLSRFNVAVFSCSNKPFGWFNAYAHAAARNDIDLVVHTGDYLYEYPRGTYPDASHTLAGREIDPAGEMIHLDDYRQRYASYRVDPALQELHRLYPMIAIWDDHEVANDTWRGGAENHQPEEGDFGARKAAAKQAHDEWLPGPDRMYQRYDIGDLLSLITLDTRNTERDEPLDLAKALANGGSGLMTFRDKIWDAPERTVLGPAQEAWLADALKGSVKAGQKWQFVAQQIVMGDMLTPKDALSWLGPNPDKRAVGAIKAGQAVSGVGIAASMDSWSGYPQARKRLLKAAESAGADLVVTSGDSHNAWAFNLSEGGKPIGVEFAGQSVTSPGFEAYLGGDPKAIQASILAANPAMTWCDVSRRGYLTVGFTPEAARADWVFMNTIRDVSTATSTGQAAVVKRGARRMTLA
jgi:alkaline phosphatase D